MRLADNITGVQHLGIPVPDLAKGIKWYQEKLGFELIQEKIILNPGMIRVGFMQLGNLVLEMYQPSGRELNEISERGNGKLDHYAIEAPNFDKCADEALQKGIQVHTSTPEGKTFYEHLGVCGVKGINLVGPSGEVVELCHDLAEATNDKTGLQGWSHLALKVENLERTRVFYGKLGFVPNGGGYLETLEGRIEIEYLTHKGFTIEVIQMIGSGLEELKARGEGRIDHVALNVTDIEDAFYEAKKEKFVLLDCMVKDLPLLKRGVRYFTMTGPDGEKIELNQIM